MPITVTWNDGVDPQTSFTMPDDVVASLDSFRQTIMSFSNGEMSVTYPTVQAMIVGVFVQTVVLPALNRFPTASIQTAQANVASAQTALAAAQVAVLPGFTA